MHQNPSADPDRQPVPNEPRTRGMQSGLAAKPRWSKNDERRAVIGPGLGILEAFDTEKIGGTGTQDQAS